MTEEEEGFSSAVVRIPTWESDGPEEFEQEAKDFGLRVELLKRLDGIDVYLLEANEANDTTTLPRALKNWCLNDGESFIVIR